MAQYQAWLPQLSEAQVAQLAQYAALLREWNTRINLVSRKDVEHLEHHHLQHALSLAKLVAFAPRARLLDVGSGGGLPGIPTAICFPQTQVFLCESMQKKVIALREMVTALKLRNVQVVHKRAEDLESKWDYVLGRAVSALPRFLGWIRDNLRPGGPAELPHGVLYFKGTLYREELAESGLEPWQVHDLQPLWDGDPYYADKFLLHFKAEDIRRWQPPEVEP